MIKRILYTACLLTLFVAPTHGQTLRIRSNSSNYLDIIVVGADKDGKVTSQTLYNVYDGFWKTISLFDLKYKHEVYDNKDMKEAGYDISPKWQKMIIYNNATTKYDTLDIAHKNKGAYLGNSNLRVKVSKSYDRSYLITDVIINDEQY